jgi:predicted Zn-dependent peptidase
MGAVYSAHSDREYTKYGLKVLKGDTHRAISLLGDAISNIALNSGELELMKE